MFTLITLVMRLRAMNTETAASVAPVLAANDTAAVERLPRAA